MARGPVLVVSLLALASALTVLHKTSPGLAKLLGVGFIVALLFVLLAGGRAVLK